MKDALAKLATMDDVNEKVHGGVHGQHKMAHVDHGLNERIGRARGQV